MKLLFCPKCEDVRKLGFKKIYCKCRKSWAYYKDERLAARNSHAVLIGLGNTSFVKAFKNRNNPLWSSHEFKAWIIGPDSEHVEVEDDLQSKNSKDSSGD